MTRERHSRCLRDSLSLANTKHDEEASCRGRFGYILGLSQTAAKVLSRRTVILLRNSVHPVRVLPIAQQYCTCENETCEILQGLRDPENITVYDQPRASPVVD